MICNISRLVNLYCLQKANDFKAADRMNYSVSNVDKAANVVLISLSEYNTLTKDNLTLTKPNDIFYVHYHAENYPEKTMILKWP